jgi:hypothetical protein
LSLFDVLITVGYLILIIFIVVLLYYLIKFLTGLYHKIDRFFHPGKKFLNRKRLMGDLTKKYGKSRAKQIFVEIREELKKTGIK